MPRHDAGADLYTGNEIMEKDLHQQRERERERRVAELMNLKQPEPSQRRTHI